MRAVSMADVAKHAGVSQRTVSNVVNDYAHVSTTTRTRVQASIDALGYRPNAAARSLRSGRTMALTLAVPGLGERYFVELAAAVIRAAGDAGLRVLVETTDGDHDTEQSILLGRDRLLTDGVIMSALALGTNDTKISPEHPLVLVGDRPLGGRVDHVGIPNRRAARAAVRHLITQGCRDIALLGGAQTRAKNTYRPRRQGWIDALRSAGLSRDPGRELGGRWTFDDGERIVTELIRRGDPLPDGVFALNDSLALGALRALARAGVSVPDNVAVIGFDDVREARQAFPALSSVAPQLDELGRSAVDLLQRQIAGGVTSLDESAEVPFDLAIRASSMRTRV